MQPPSYLYGTAWKEDDTERCVVDALAAGFRGIDTANQRKHYYEEGVGKGIARSGVARDQLYLQTKFTFRDGQDHRLPYDERAPIATQVAQSFDSSLAHFATDYLDSFVLHGPSVREGLTREDVQAWRAMEALAGEGRTRFIGVSNCNVGQVQALLDLAKVRPAFVQNRCYARTGWDREVRRLCARHGIVYQGFSLLTANRPVLAHPAVLDIAARHKRHVTQVIFRFALDVGMLPLTGTTSAEHMRGDLSIGDFRLDRTEIVTIETLVER